MLILLTALASASTLVVDFTDTTTTAEMQDLDDDNLILDTAWSDLAHPHGLATLEVSDTDEAIAYLSSLPGVESVEPRMVYTVEGIRTESKPNDPQLDLQWHMQEIHTLWSHTHTKSGEGVVVAVLDTGFTLTSDMEPGRVMSGKSFTGESVTDVHGHGTHCSSTIGEWTGNGIAGIGVTTKAQIMPVKVLSNEGYGYNDWIANGIYYAADNGAGVISMSLGGPSSSKVIADSVAYAIKKGVVIVAAAGNDGCKECMGYPASYPGVISVGATGPDHKRSYYSSYGKKLTLAAPGGNKQIKNGGVWQMTNSKGTEGFLEWQGTSMATPHVAGAVAVLLSEGVPPGEITELLTSTAVGPKSIEVGAGIIDIKAAVTKFRGSDAAITEASPGWHDIKQTLFLALMALFCGFGITRAYGFSNKFTGASMFWTGIWSGALVPLTLLPLPWVMGLPGTFHIMDLPELMFGEGMGGFILWLSPLVILPAVFTFTPFTRTRSFVFGLTIALTTYLLADAMWLFNPPWSMSDMAGRAWLLIGALLSVGLITVVSEFHKQSEAE